MSFIEGEKSAFSALLNHPGFHSTAAISAQVWPVENGRPYGEIVISDCYRVVTLQLDGGDEVEYRNGLHKLDVLIDVLTRTRDAFTRET